MKLKFVEAFVTFFYVGKMPKAPGTFGTLATIPLWFVCAQHLSPIAYMIFVLFLLVSAMVVSEIYERQKGTHDNSEIVIDEVVGFMITMTWLPINLKSILAGFILFRIFDVLKPFPISYLDRKVQGGVGVVIDDVAAGIFASIILQIGYAHGLLG